MRLPRAASDLPSEASAEWSADDATTDEIVHELIETKTPAKVFQSEGALSHAPYRSSQATVGQAEGVHSGMKSDSATKAQWAAGECGPPTVDRGAMMAMVEQEFGIRQFRPGRRSQGRLG